MSLSGLRCRLRPLVGHRVGVAFSEGPKLLPFYENLAKWQLLPLYAQILSVTFTVLPQTPNTPFFQSAGGVKTQVKSSQVPSGKRDKGGEGARSPLPSPNAAFALASVLTPAAAASIATVHRPRSGGMHVELRQAPSR